MKKVVDYEILAAAQLEVIESFVLEALKDGWEPCGGLIVGHSGYGQAMVKYEQDKVCAGCGSSYMDNPCCCQQMQSVVKSEGHPQPIKCQCTSTFTCFNCRNY